MTNDLDVASRGWRAGAQLSLELGPLRLDVGTSAHHVDTRLGGGTYEMRGLSLTHVIELSPSLTGWAAVTAGERRWREADRALAGQGDAFEVKLELGTTLW